MPLECCVILPLIYSLQDGSAGSDSRLGCYSAYKKYIQCTCLMTLLQKKTVASLTFMRR